MVRYMVLVIFLWFASTKVYSLVDYSDEANTVARPSPRVMRNAPPQTRSKTPAPIRAESSRSGALLGFLNLESRYVSETIETPTGEAKVNGFHFKSHIKASHSIFLDLSYQTLATDDEFLAQSTQYQKGNPEAILGLNWLDLGGEKSDAKFNLLFGHRWGQKSSEFATSRNDFILGVETIKKMSNFVLGLSYKLDLTGRPKSNSEYDIGNIHALTASLGVFVSPDIRFALHAKRITINESSDDDFQDKRLDEKLVFTIVNPETHLVLLPSITLKFGGTFKAKRNQFKSEYVNLHNPHLIGLWGNSIYTSLSFGI